MGSTLTRVRFITWTTQYTCWLVVRSCVYAMVLNTKFLDSLPGIIWFVKSIDHNFVHQVFGAVAGELLSLDNWRFILLLRLGIFFSEFLKMNSRVSWWFVEVWLAVKPCLISLDRGFNLSSQELVDFYQSCCWSSDLLRLGRPLAMSSVLDRSFLWKLGWLWSHV